jgi:DNA-binding MarR family transcriptional regulator
MLPRPLTFLSPIHKATRQIGIHLSAAVDGLGISVEEGHLLSYLRSYAPCAIFEIHRVFGWKRSTLTSILDRLEERGHVVREVHPGDRRSFLVRLTKRGARLAERVQQPVAALEECIRRAISDEDLAGFQRVMEAIGIVTHVQVQPVSRTPVDGTDPSKAAHAAQAAHQAREAEQEDR